jgi:hypothetical protein
VAQSQFSGLAVGEQVVIGAGTPNAEVHTITGFGSIFLDSPLAHSHTAGEAIVVLAAAPHAWDPPPAAGPASTPLPPPRAKPRLKGTKYAPKVTGTRRAGKVLRCSAGSWLGTAPIRYGYSWQLAKGRKWSSIRKATKSSYRVPKAYRGRKLRCGVTARNAVGAVAAYSAAAAISRR